MRDDEQALLGALVLDGRKALELDLTADQFSTEDGRQIWQAVVRVASKGMTVDPMLIGEEIGDTTAAARIANGAGAGSNVQHYADSIRKAARLRRIAQAASSALNAANETGADPDTIADDLMGAMSETASGSDTWDMESLMDDFLSQWEQAKQSHAAGEVQGIRTGWSAVDRMLNGLRGGRLYVLGARPKMGKTSFALALQHNAARSGCRVGFASAEMSARECASRWVAAAAGVDTTVLQTGKGTPGDDHRIREAQNRLRTLPIYTLDRAGVSPARIRRQCMAWKQRYGLDLLVVDYLQRLKPDEAGDRRDLTVGAMARAFKTAARDLDIPVVLLAQLSRDLEHRPDKRPMPSDFRDSGEIEQEADVIAFLYRDWIYNDRADPNEAEILVRGNRHGSSGKATLRFEPEFQRWLDRDMADYEEVA